MRRYLLILSILLSFLSDPVAKGEERKLINSSEQISSNYGGGDTDNISNIADGRPETRYYSGETSTDKGAPYIQIDLSSSGLTKDACSNKDMVVYQQRTTGDYWDRTRPTAFEVKALFDYDSNWETICYVYFLYRGSGTHEYSTRIEMSRLFPENKSQINKMRFYVTANNGHKYDPVTGYREMSMSEFQIYTLDKNDNFPNGLKDRLHLLTDYQRNFYSFEFINTNGVFHNSNIIKEWDNLTGNDTTGFWEKGIHFPDFRFIEKENSMFPLGEGQKRQATHTVEHTLYAVPGDVVALYPYYQMHEASQYEENFSHWYDWETGGMVKYPDQTVNGITTHVDYNLLDFLIDPSEIQITEKYGFFGGKALPSKQYTISSVEEYISAVNEINEGNKNCYIEITSDLDFTGYDVPILCQMSDFTGCINGGGHKISNLHLYYEGNDVGIIGRAGNGAKIMNLVVDGSCGFIGNMSVGLIGYVGNGEIVISNVSTSATVMGTAFEGEHKAAGLIGTTDGNSNKIIIENCYVGGTIGNPDRGSNNAALIGWGGINDDGAYIKVKNTYVDAKVYNIQDNRYYFRYNDGAESKVSVEGSYGNASDEQQDFSRWISSNGWTAQTNSYQVGFPVYLQASGWINDGSRIVPPLNQANTIDVGTINTYENVVYRINVGALPSNTNINITADLNFDELRNRVLPLGTKDRPYRGVLNGNGHTISNLEITDTHEFDNGVEVYGTGLVGVAGDGCEIRNLVLDSSCKFTGWRSVGLIGDVNNCGVRLSNISSAAKIVATANDVEQKAAGLIGSSEGNGNRIDISDCFIGGIIGNDAYTGARNNAAISGWLGVSEGGYIKMSRVWVNAVVNNPDNENRLYYRTNGNLTLDKCYGNYKNQDFTQKESDVTSIPDGFAGWKVAEKIVLPPMPIEISSPDGYIEVVKQINNGELPANTVIRIVEDLDFNDKTVSPLGTSDRNFIGTLNGNGHKISNLAITDTHEFSNGVEVYGTGLIGVAGDGVEVKNLVIDNSCSFTGWRSVGIIGTINNGNAKISNIITEAIVKAMATDQEQKAAGLVGSSEGNDNKIEITDCYIGGTIGNNEYTGAGNNAAVTGWAGIVNDNAYLRLSRVWVDATVFNPEDESKVYYRTNGNGEASYCYGKTAEENFVSIDMNLSTTIYIPETRTDIPDSDKRGNMDRKTGTVATFFCPRNPYITSGEQHNLPFKDGRDEFIIAADFSQKFSYDVHVQDKQIIEPVIAYRHIFHIKDGKEFAERFSGSPDKNKEYIRENQKFVSARADVPFQIRFETAIPAPTENNRAAMTRSMYYYKISDSDYRRVCTMDIEVYNEDTGEKLSNNKDEANYFYAGQEFTGQGTRKIDGVTYSLCAGTDKYYRMLMCDKPTAGRYIVKLIGKDINGNRIKIYNGKDESGVPMMSDVDLEVMEYHITFLPKSGASVVKEEDLYSETDNTYMHAREEVLKEKYGTPKSSVTFDEYRYFDTLDDSDKKKFLVYDNDGKAYYKWPVSWEQSNYGFGYNEYYDYNMYVIANHSSKVRFNGAASLYNNGEGLYDRLYYKTKNNTNSETDIQKGYFYYVNASTDPGVMAKLTINDLCSGSTIHVSAWMAEFTDKEPETANISFNFVAVLKNDADRAIENLNVDGSVSTGMSPVGESWEINNRKRVVLHNFITGYVPPQGGTTPKNTGDTNDLRGEWLNVYYSFVPRLSEFSAKGINSDDVHHYELELDNNCKSSAGADYAIDDVMIYLVKPVVYASQIEPVCNDKNAKVKIEAPFDVLLETLGESEKKSQDYHESGFSEKITLYYTFLDKEKYDNFKDEEIIDPDLLAQERFDASVLQKCYGSESYIKYGKLDFNLDYNDNPEYKKNLGIEDFWKAFREIAEDGERMIVFHTNPKSEDLTTGKEYYVLIKSVNQEEPAPEEGNEYSFFDPENPCAKRCEFMVKSSTMVKIDGVVQDNLGNISVCENQSPVVQLNVWGMDSSGLWSEVEKNAVADWYDGTVEEFEAEKDEEKDISLKDALALFREFYPSSETVDNCEPLQELTQDMLDYIERMATEIHEDGEPLGNRNPKLMLYLPSYVFPPLGMAAGSETSYSVLAIPIVTEKDNMKICKSPTEVRISVRSQAPVLNHGFYNLKYPENLKDVPLRIGLSQLKSVSRENEIVVENGNYLKIPVRSVRNIGSDVSEMKLNGAEIVLVQTNDPEYKNLGTINEEGKEIEKFLVVGEVQNLVARTDGKENYFDAVFDKSFNFKEGYFYRMRFQFEEKGESGDDVLNADEPLCDGQDVFTIKVVPEYQMWNGAAGVNWNNDANWNRVTSKDLMVPENGASGDVEPYHVTDGKSVDGKNVNGNSHSYAPLDFTKVIIPQGTVIPQLGERKHSRESVSGNAQVNVTDGKNSDKSYDWVTESPKAAKVDDSDAVDATVDIQYDMVYQTYEGDNNVYCRPWYANCAEQVHFKPGGEIINQHYLDYVKAWVDVELVPSRWYTLALPLQEVFAGDMYLPSANACQETELFRDITFDKNLNDRFKPAVFQRGWDKSSALVYELPATSDGTGKSSNVAIKLNWSHVYNDVKEVYGAGTGFSIKTDVSRLGTTKPKSVVFRLPKADESFDYYSMDSNTKGNNTPISRTEGQYRLNGDNEGEGTITATNSNGSKYFLVGNPYMTHMDMAEFLKGNEDKIEKKYWILTAEGQQAAVFDETKDVFIGTVENLGIVAPMQGFFVEAKITPADGKLKLSYDPKMMTRNGSGSSAVGTRSGEAAVPMLRISALAGDETLSSAILAVGGQYDSAYSEAEDVIAIDNADLGVTSTVYTVASATALVINRTSDADGVEIGVIAKDDERTTLRFDGVETVEGLALYDRETGELTDLYDGMEYIVKGGASGRLYLMRSLPESLETPIEWRVNGNEVTVTASPEDGVIAVKVFDSLGRSILSRSENSNEIRFTIEKGVYMMEIEAGNKHRTEKIRI